MQLLTHHDDNNPRPAKRTHASGGFKGEIAVTAHEFIKLCPASLVSIFPHLSLAHLRTSWNQQKHDYWRMTDDGVAYFGGTTTTSSKRIGGNRIKIPYTQRRKMKMSSLSCDAAAPQPRRLLWSNPLSSSVVTSCRKSPWASEWQESWTAAPSIHRMDESPWKHAPWTNSICQYKSITHFRLSGNPHHLLTTTFGRVTRLNSLPRQSRINDK